MWKLTETNRPRQTDFFSSPLNEATSRAGASTPPLSKAMLALSGNTLAGKLDFYLNAMSPDGRVSESIVQALINEQRELVDVKTAGPLSQVVDFGPLNRVVMELNFAK
jgi:hypothetical protein